MKTLGLNEIQDISRKTGMKPTEGKLSHHSMTLERWTPKKSLSWNVAKTWEENDEKVEMILSAFKI